MTRSYEDYVFFWRPSGPEGWASQWYPSPFHASVAFHGDADAPLEEVRLPTAEHWMMLQKALLFRDYDIARQVLAIGGNKSADCAKIRSMGRKVKNFDEEVWVKERGKLSGWLVRLDR